MTHPSYGEELYKKETFITNHKSSLMKNLLNALIYIYFPEKTSAIPYFNKQISNTSFLL